MDGYWRFYERHKICVMYFDENRSAQKSLTDEIVFRGQTYPMNAQVSTRYDAIVAELAYEYAFLRGERYELAGSFGIHDLSFKLQLTAVGYNVNVQQSAHADLNGPLPVIGVHYLWEFNPHLSLGAMFQFFALKFDQYDGNLQDYSAASSTCHGRISGLAPAGMNSGPTSTSVTPATTAISLGAMEVHESSSDLLTRGGARESLQAAERSELLKAWLLLFISTGYIYTP